MPVIDAQFHIGVAQVAWISKSFLLASAIGLLLGGWISDHFGRLFGQFISMALASGMILFIDNINASIFDYKGLLLASKLSFIVFGILSCVGVYLSYQRVESKIRQTAP